MEIQGNPCTILFTTKNKLAVSNRPPTGQCTNGRRDGTALQWACYRKFMRHWKGTQRFYESQCRM